MALLCAVILALFFAGAWIYYGLRSEQVKEQVRGFDRAYRAVYLSAAQEDAQERLVSEACAYLSAQASAAQEQPLTDAFAELQAGARVVERYDCIVTDMSVDYRYGEVRVIRESVLDYAGYGGYLFPDEDEDIVYTGKCKQTYQMVREDGAWKIASVRTEYPEN